MDRTDEHFYMGSYILSVEAVSVLIPLEGPCSILSRNDKGIIRMQFSPRSPSAPAPSICKTFEISAGLSMKRYIHWACSPQVPLTALIPILCGMWQFFLSSRQLTFSVKMQRWQWNVCLVRRRRWSSEPLILFFSTIYQFKTEFL